MPQKPTLAYYIAHHAGEEANEMLMNHGIRPARNTAELEYLLGEFISNGGDDALEAVMEIHPDREEIMRMSGGSLPRQRHSSCCGNSNFSGDDVRGYSNCSGCNGKCGGANRGYSNASGDNSGGTPTAHSMISGNMTMAITAIAVIGLIGLFMIKAN